MVLRARDTIFCQVEEEEEEEEEEGDFWPVDESVGRVKEEEEEEGVHPSTLALFGWVGWVGLGG